MMTNSDSTINHPDIEIYLKGISADKIEAWLSERFSQVKKIKQKQRVNHFSVCYQEREFPVLIIEKAAKAYTSLLFESDQTPWQQDTECAREAFKYFNQEIRCIASGWSEGDEPDEWFSISERGEETIIWKL